MGDKSNYYFQHGTKGPEFNKAEQFALGLTSGGLKIFEGIAELGAGFIDYAFDTKLLDYIERNFPKINVDDGVGKFTELLVQYGLPYFGAAKIASKLIGLKRLDTIRKGTGVSGVATKMGYYGGLGVITDPFISTSRDVTLGQAFGLSTKPEIEDLTGRAKAAATLKQKTIMGIEAGALGAALPVAGAGLKGAVVGGAKVAAPVAKGVNFAIVNPLAKIIAGDAVGTNVTQQLFQKITKGTKDAVNFTRDKLNLASIDEIRLIRNPETFRQRMQQKIINNLTTAGALPRNAFDIRKMESTLFLKEGKILDNLTKNLNKSIDNIITNKELTKAETITARQSMFDDIGKVLSRDKEIRDLPKGLQDSVQSLRNGHDDLKKRMVDLMQAENILTLEGKNLLKARARLDPEEYKNLSAILKDGVSDVVEKGLLRYLNRGIHNSYAVFQRGKKFTPDEASLKGAREYVFKYLKEHGDHLPGTSDSVLRSEAHAQVETFLNQAKNSHTAEYFFDTALPTWLIRSEARPGAKITFLGEDVVGFGRAARRELPDEIEKLLGKESVEQGILNTNVVLADIVAKKNYINQMLQFNKSIDTGKFIFTPDYKRVFAEFSKGFGIEIKNIADLEKALIARGTPDKFAGRKIREILQGDVARQFREQYPTLADRAPTMRDMGEAFRRKTSGEDPFGLYSKMINHYVPENLFDALTGEMKGFGAAWEALPLYKTFLTFKGLTQAGKTVFSPVTQVRNFTSASFFALHNGHIGTPFGKNPHTFTDIVRAHLDEVFPPGVKITKDSARKYLEQSRLRSIELGVTQSNPMAREIEDLFVDIAAGKSRYSSTQAIFKKLIDSPTFQKSQELYMKGDDIWKHFGWLFTQSQLRQALPKNPGFNVSARKLYAELFNKEFNFTTGTGVAKTYDEVVEEFAAQFVKNTYPNYNYVPQFIKDMRRLPLGNFISFPAEILRTSANLMKFSAKMMASENPVIRQMGAKSFVGQAMGFSTGATLATASLSAIGMSRDEYNSFRETQVPEWNRFSDLIMLSRADKPDGNVVYRYVPFSYQNPYEYLQAPFYALAGEMAAGKKVGADWDDRVLNAMGSAFMRVFEPFIDESILTELLADVTVRGGQPRRGGRIYPEGAPVGDKLWAMFGHVMGGIQPGIFTQGGRFMQAVAGEKTRYGKQYTIGDEALAVFAGVRVYDADLSNNLNFSYNDFARIDRQNTSLAKRNFFAENATLGTRALAYENYLEDSYRSYTEFRKITEDLKALGISDTYIKKFLKQRGAKKHIQKSIRRGQFIPPNYKTFYEDERFKKLAKKLGVSRASLFPRSEMRNIYFNYRYRDLLQSLSTIRSQIRKENQPTPPTPAPVTTAQGQGTTANVPPVASAQVPVTPPAQQQLAGLQSLSPTQDYVLTDPDLRTIAARRNQRQTVA